MIITKRELKAKYLQTDESYRSLLKEYGEELVVKFIANDLCIDCPKFYESVADNDEQYCDDCKPKGLSDNDIYDDSDDFHNDSYDSEW